MLVLQPRQVKIFLLATICICGLSLGYLAAQISGLLIQPPVAATTPDTTAAAKAATRPTAVDSGLIVEKNIFDPASRGIAAAPEQPDRPEPVRAVAGGNLKLFGTVDGGKNPLALIQSGGKVNIYRIGDDLPGGSELLSVARNEAVILQADGSQAKLAIVKPEIVSSATATSAPAGSGIRDLGDNRWAVSRSEVEKARSNLNQLLKSAHMEPNIINGQTEGFLVKMVRPKSLLAQLGIRRGDTVTRVNGVALNSPEKALQVFQQLREAKRLTVDLKRNNENLTFDYEVN